MNLKTRKKKSLWKKVKKVEVLGKMIVEKAIIMKTKKIKIKMNKNIFYINLESYIYI